MINCNCEWILDYILSVGLFAAVICRFVFYMVWKEKQ